MRSAPAYAKINLALVVGPLRADGKHEVATVLQRVDLHDVIELEHVGDRLVVEGFEEDTLVRATLESLAERAGAVSGWRVRIEKRIPVAAGLGGGSSDAATALRLGNDSLPNPLDPDELHEVAARIGADVPFFLGDSPALASGDGSTLSSLRLPQDFWVLLALPKSERKESTASVYARFEALRGAEGFEQRHAVLLETLSQVEHSRDLAVLPRNDLAASVLALPLEWRGAIRADVSGAGPVVYALFEGRDEAARAARELEAEAATWVCRPVAVP